MGQVIEVEEPDTTRLGLHQPIEFFVVGRGVIILVDEIDQRAANAFDRWHIHCFAGAFKGFGALCNRMIKRRLRIHHAPAHRRRAGAMLFHETRGKTVRVGI